MGTRSLTFIHNGEQQRPFMCMYRHYDGYPSGHGIELYNFLAPIRLVNGLDIDDSRAVANGAGCLAAQMVCHFKDGPGGIYLQPATTTDSGQDYEYHIFVADKVVTMKVKEVGYHKKKVLFEGPLDGFLEFCNKDD